MSEHCYELLILLTFYLSHPTTLPSPHNFTSLSSNLPPPLLLILFLQTIESHEVIQFHFVVWPDFNVPQEASTMLKFVRHVRSHVCSDHGPMLVHCSAGVGRTGTFITIDVMLQKMAL